MQTTTITTPDGQSYPVVTGRGFLNNIGSILAGITNPCRVMLVSDSNVAPLYLDIAHDPSTIVAISPLLILPLQLSQSVVE